MGYINGKLGGLPFDLWERINIRESMSGDPQLLGIYVSLASSIGVFVFRMVLNVVRWTLPANDQAIEDVQILRNR
jgi:hypothetical protein